MVKINAQPVWKPVLDASVQFAPVTRTMITQARKAYRDALKAAMEDAGLTLESEVAVPWEAYEAAVDAFKDSVVGQTLSGWTGVINEDTTEPLEATAENIASALGDLDFGPALIAASGADFVWERELEKNVSSPSRTGAIAGSKATNDMAPPTTAPSSAPPAPADKTASRTQTGAAKVKRRPPAPSTATPAAPRKAKPSGK